MNDNICVMCGAQLPAECGKQYCMECEKNACEPLRLDLSKVVNNVVASKKSLFDCLSI